MTKRVTIVGASGTMGGVVENVIAAAPGFEVFSRIGSKDPLSKAHGSDIVFDVSLPTVSGDVVDFAVANSIPVIVGTSGWTKARIEALASALGPDPTTGVLIVPNFALGSVLTTVFAARAACFFDSAEVIEGHHLGKVDSPSGTAIRTAELIAQARGERGPLTAGNAAQPSRGLQVGGVPVHSIRMAGIVSRQDIVFGRDGEVLTLSHDVTSYAAYEPGVRLALQVAVGIRGVRVGLEQFVGLGG